MAEHRRLNPPGLFDSSSWGFHQIQISSGSRIVHFAGQGALDTSAAVVGPGDFGAQMATCLANIDTACRSAGVSRQDIASLRVYVVDHEPRFTPIMIEQLLAFFGADATPPATLVGVARLGMPDMMIEIEAVAVA